MLKVWTGFGLSFGIQNQLSNDFALTFLYFSQFVGEEIKMHV